MFYKYWDKFDRAEPLYQRARAILEPRMREGVAVCLNNLGTARRALGELAAAEGHFRQALTIREEVLGPDHPALGALLNNLGELCADHPTCECARENLKRLLADGA